MVLSQKFLLIFSKTGLVCRLNILSGELGRGTHAWLELDDIVIDITGDQFDGRPPVFFAPRDAWYCLWEDIERSDPNHAPSGRNSRETREVFLAVICEAGLPNPYA